MVPLFVQLMGIFTKLGRQVEEFKQTAKKAANSDETYQCPACDEQFDSKHEQCPECGEQIVESTRTEK